MATAVTRDVTRTNPTAPTLGTIQRNAQVTLFKCVLSGADGAVALDAGQAQQTVEEIGSHGMMIQVISTGLEIFIVGDRHAVDLNSIATRLGTVIGAGSVTASGVWTFTAGGTLTVTEPTTFENL